MGFLGDLPHVRWVSPHSIRMTREQHPSLVGGLVAAAALAVLVWRAMAGPASGSESRIVSVGTPVPGLAADDRRYALIVAVEDYDDKSLPSLEGARGGAEDLHDALVTHAGFRPDHIRRVDGSGPEAAVPTRSNVLRALHELLARVPDDGRAMVLFAFTGRGAAAGGNAYLLPRDAIAHAGDALLASTAIDFDADVRRRFTARGLDQAVLLLDSTLADPARGVGATLSPAFVAATSRTGRTDAAVTVLHATAPGAASYLDPSARRPLFTAALVDGIRGAAARTTDGWVTLGSLLRYVQETVPLRARALRATQAPTADVKGIDPHEIRFARVAAPSVSTSADLRCGLRGDAGGAFAFDVDAVSRADATVESVKVVTGGALRAPFAAPIRLDARRSWAVRRTGGRPLLAVARTSIGECAAYVEPAPAGGPVYAVRWHSVNAEGVPYREVFKHATENRRGRTDVVATGRDALRDRAGRITRIEYSCEGAACGWSRHPDASRGYEADVTVQAPASFSWRRRWEGEPAIDVYTVHYEMPARVCASGCASNTLD
jgi:uncharacterized caspase-like protein